MSSGKKLGRRKREQLAQERRERRTQWLWRGVVACLAMGAVALAGFIVHRIETEERLRVLDQFIAEVETAFLAWGEEMAPTIAALESENLREQLPLPFELVKINRANPWKNSQRLLTESNNIGNGAGELRQKNLNFFRYDWFENVPASPGLASMAAAYMPVTRVMAVSKDFNAHNTLDLLILYHELFHVTQDTGERARLQSRAQYDAYVQFYTGLRHEKPRMVLNFETTAYAYELEMLDLAVNGRLREMVRDSNKQATLEADAATLAAMLGAREDQVSTLELLCEFARAYFPEGIASGELPNAFVKMVAERYVDAGYALYATNNGLLNARRVRADDI